MPSAPTVSTSSRAIFSFASAAPRFHPGTNVGKGKDDTLFSLVNGTVKFERYGKDRKKVSVTRK